MNARSNTIAFVVLTTQRTGSTWLQTLLDSHPSVAVHGEMFLRNASRVPPFGASGLERFEYFSPPLGSARRRRHRPFRSWLYLDRLYQDHVGLAAVGFKLMYDQLVRFPEVVPYLMKHRVRVIHLVRRNLLDVIISREAMEARGLAHATRKEDVTNLQVTLDEQTLHRRLQFIDAQVVMNRHMLRTLAIPHVEIVYEDLLGNSGSLTDVIHWLGVRNGVGVDLSSKMLKLNDKRQSELVTNHEAVARLLRGTKYASLVRS